MATRKHVIVTREWHEPTIRIGVSDDAITIALELPDFLSALSEEYGMPASTLTKAQHLARLSAAAEVVTTKLKRETTAVI